jgi:hypothetical protein
LGSVGPRDLKPAAIRAGACVAARQLGWARRVCGRSRRTRRVSVRMLGIVPDKIVGNSPTLSGEDVIAWFIRLRVQPLTG